MWRVVLGLAFTASGCGRIGFLGNGSRDGSAGDDSGRLDDASGALPDGVMPSDAIPSSGLLLYFTLDDTTGNDSSGNGHSVVCNAGECPTLASGKFGAAYAFDGINDKIRVPYDPSFDTMSGFTAAVWFLRINPHHELSLFSKQNGTGATQHQSWSLGMDSSGAPVFYTATPTTEDFLFDYDIPPDGTWTHIATTWDGTTKRIYTNGVLIDQSAFAISWDVHDIYIGVQQRDTLFYYPFNGSIDEVRLYDHALSPSEIALLAQ